MELLFALGVGLYAATTATYLGSLWSPRPALVRAGHVLLAVTLLAWAGLLVAWMAEAGARGGARLWMGVSAWSLSALYLALLRRFPVAGLGSFVSALATLLAVFALLVGGAKAGVAEGPLVQWVLRVHIGLAFIGITAFAFATAVSIVYLIQARTLKQKTNRQLARRLPPLDVLDRLSLRGIIVGFPFYTVALLLGSAQALRGGQETGLRGAYVLAVLSWLIYGTVLQARLTAGWRGRRAAILTTAGLVVAMGVVAHYSLGVG